jgi:glycosyltransferase involved in cell wall biosynthesis
MGHKYMRILILSPNDPKVLKCGVRAAKLREYLKKNGVRTISLPGLDYREVSISMVMNYLKLLFFLLTRRQDDLVLIENERSAWVLKVFKKLGFRLALDIRDNRALQHSAYNVVADQEVMDTIKKVLLLNIDMCDFVFVVSESCKELYPKKYHNKIFVIENASDPCLFQYKELPEELSVGFISGIAPGRGTEFLIKAGEIIKEKVPGVKLYIAGTPSKESEQYYEKLKNKYESSWVTFRDDVFYSVNAGLFFKDCYLTVIPHPDHIHYNTTIPVKVLDSMACGRPVVSTNCKETAKILNTYHCGLVSDFTEQDFAGKITQLLLDREEATIMGKNGRRIVEDIYNWDNMARKIIHYTSGQAA